MRLAVFSSIACSLAAACAEPPIEMRLVLPDPTTVRDFDLSCVFAVRARAIGNDRGDGRGVQVTEDCFDLATPQRTFADLAATLRGQFQLDVPRGGLAGVQLSGFSGRCSDMSSTFESIVYGGAPSNQGATLEIPLVPTVSCDAGESYTAHVIDLSSLYATLPAGGTCAPPPDPIRVYAGLFRPRMLGDSAARTEFEFGHASAEISNGRGKLQSYRPTAGNPACPALGYRGTATIGVTCVRPAAQARGVCSDSGEAEVIALPISAAAEAIDFSLVQTFGPPVFGSVWESSGNRVPIRDATVELVAPSRGKVVYVDIAAEAGALPPRLRPMTPLPAATATNASGGFILYMPGDATDLIVRAPNHVPQTVRVASAPDVLPSLAIALARQ